MHMAKPKKPRTFKQRQADRARRSTHAQPFIWTGEAGRSYLTGTGRTACGKKIFDKQGRTAAIYAFGAEQPTCKACVDLLMMGPKQYATHVQAEKEKLAAVREKQQSRADAERAAAVQAKVGLVAAYRDDALVALDAYLSDVPYERMREVLGAAVTKYRLDNPNSRGEKLWVMTGEMHADKRTVLCRFCRRKIGQGDLGKDYSASWFDTHSWREFPTLSAYQDVYGDSPSHVCVDRHVTLCALAYLAGVPCAEPVP